MRPVWLLIRRDITPYEQTMIILVPCTHRGIKNLRGARRDLGSHRIKI
jgi:hypothetical protein